MRNSSASDSNSPPPNSNRNQQAANATDMNQAGPSHAPSHHVTNLPTSATNTVTTASLTHFFVGQNPSLSVTNSTEAPVTNASSAPTQAQMSDAFLWSSSASLWHQNTSQPYPHLQPLQTQAPSAFSPVQPQARHPLSLHQNTLQPYPHLLPHQTHAPSAFSPVQPRARYPLSLHQNTLQPYPPLLPPQTHTPSAFSPVQPRARYPLSLYQSSSQLYPPLLPHQIQAPSAFSPVRPQSRDPLSWPNAPLQPYPPLLPRQTQASNPSLSSRLRAPAPIFMPRTPQLAPSLLRLQMPQASTSSLRPHAPEASSSFSSLRYKRPLELEPLSPELEDQFARDTSSPYIKYRKLPDKLKNAPQAKLPARFRFPYIPDFNVLPPNTEQPRTMETLMVLIKERIKAGVTSSRLSYELEYRFPSMPWRPTQGQIDAIIRRKEVVQDKGKGKGKNRQDKN